MVAPHLRQAGHSWFYPVPVMVIFYNTRIQNSVPEHQRTEANQAHISNYYIDKLWYLIEVVIS